MARVLGLRAFIEAIVSAEDVHHGKPDPEVFVTAAATLGVTPDRSIVVEDAEAGVEAARRAGMRCIGVGAAASAPADLTVESLDQLPADAFDRLLK
jgi:beta-phosphoglucomutase